MVRQAAGLDPAPSHEQRPRDDCTAAPVVVCDICGDMIGDCTYGAAVFRDPKPTNENVKVDVLHVHKGTCHDKADERFNENKDCGWQELAMHLYLLCSNTELDEVRFANEARYRREFDQ